MPRLLRSGGPYTVLPQLVTIATNEGGHSEPQYPKAFGYAGLTYIGGVSGVDGDVTVSVWDTTATVTRVLHAALGGTEGNPDMHDNPALLRRSLDNRLLAAYCAHADSTVRTRLSTDSLDDDPYLANGFATEQSLDSQLGGVLYDYPVLVEAGGLIWLFVREIPSGSVDAHLRYSTSADDGATWAALTDLYNSAGKTAYWSISSRDDGRIDVLTFDDNEGAVTNNLLKHFYLLGGSRYQSDGDLIAASLPLAPADIDTIASTGGHHLFNIERGADGRVGFTCSRRVSGVHQVIRGVYDSGWTIDQIATSPGPGGLGSGPYSWGNAIDPDDFDHALVSRWSGGVADLWEYRYTGGSWAGQQLTSGSTDKVWPIFVKNPTGLRAFYLDGFYNSYLDFTFDIIGIRR